MATRREFLKNTCMVCAGTALLGLTSSHLTSCSSLPIYKTKLNQKSVAVPVASFGESSMIIVRDMQVLYDILLIKKSSQEYLALYMNCTHQENPVTATASGLFCSAHGSRFDLEGNATKEPALKPLKRFKTELQVDNVYINLNS